MPTSQALWSGFFRRSIPFCWPTRKKITSSRRASINAFIVHRVGSCRCCFSTELSSAPGPACAAARRSPSPCGRSQSSRAASVKALNRKPRAWGASSPRNPTLKSPGRKTGVEIAPRGILFGGLFLGIQGNAQFGGKLVSIERAARKVPAVHLERRHGAPPVVHLQDQIFGVGILFHVHFAEGNVALLQEQLCATAVAAPTRAVHDDFAHALLRPKHAVAGHS